MSAIPSLPISPTPPNVAKPSAGPAVARPVAPVPVPGAAGGPSPAPQQGPGNPSSTTPSSAPAASSPNGPAPAPRHPVPAPEHVWLRFFRDWPAEIPKRGIVVSRLNESCPFKAFMLRSDVVLLQRTAPDSLGARFVLLPYEEIAAVKLTDPLRQEAFSGGGFQGQLTQ